MIYPFNIYHIYVAIFFFNNTQPIPGKSTTRHWWNSRKTSVSNYHCCHINTTSTGRTYCTAVLPEATFPLVTNITKNLSEQLLVPPPTPKQKISITALLCFIIKHKHDAPMVSWYTAQWPKTAWSPDRDHKRDIQTQYNTMQQKCRTTDQWFFKMLFLVIRYFIIIISLICFCKSDQNSVVDPLYLAGSLVLKLSLKNTAGKQTAHRMLD